MARFESRIHELLPDLRQLLHPRTKEIDPLPAGDFGIQVVAFGHLADGDQAVRRDLSSGDARHHRIGAIFLDIGKEAIVGVLEREMLRLEQIIIPARRQHRSHQRFTDLTPVAVAVFVDQLIEAADVAYAHQVIDLLP